MITLTFIKRGLLVFWTVWLAIVTFTNLAEALVAMQVLSPALQVHSGNLTMMREVMARYPLPSWMPAVLFAGVIAWEALATALFARASLLFRASPSPQEHAAARDAIAVSLGLWAAFLVADEIFMAYQVADTHMRLLIAHLGMLLVFELCRDPRPSA